MMRIHSHWGDHIRNAGREQKKNSVLFRTLPAAFLFSLICAAGLLSQANSLEIEIERISITDSTRYRNVPASFPYPVLTLFTVKDQLGRYVHGLADTTRWLTSQDFNQNGSRVNDVWKSLLERHDPDTTLPADPDIKHTEPGYMVTEVSDVEGFSLSTSLVMDFSGSMIPYFKDVDEAGHVFVDLMRPGDRAAVLKFSGDVYVLQGFTSDTALLHKAVDNDSTSFSGTSIYDAIYEGITLSLDQPGRRAVIAYTDGRDHLVGHSLEDVIAYARNTKTPVFTIGLFGTGPQYDRLQYIAEATGGTYAFAPSVDSLKVIYRSIFGLIRGHYVLAHQSTDPYYNGIRRRLTLNLQHNGVEGKASGTYTPPFLFPNLGVTLEGITDSLGTAGGNPRYFLAAGDTVEYRIRVKNSGRGQANKVQVANALPDSVHPYFYSVTPSAVRNDSLFWSFNHVNPGDSLTILFRGRASAIMPYGDADLINTTSISCFSDSLPGDNTARSVITGMGLPDFTVKCYAPAYKVSPGYPVKIRALIGNSGNANIVQPFRVTFAIEGVAQPAAVDTVSALQAGQGQIIEAGLVFPAAGSYTVRVTADADNDVRERNEGNNTDSAPVSAGIDSVTMRFSGISIEDTVRARTASFPEAVLSRVVAVDQNAHPIRGLADNTKWAGMNDPSTLGPAAGQYWTRLLERHEENASMPASQDVRQSCLITEIPDSPIFPLILIDGSEAMQPHIGIVRERLNAFVASFGAGDMAAAAVLDGTARLAQPYTRNASLLDQAFNQACTAQTRPLVDGLAQALAWTQSRGRKAILAVTAGPDMGSAGTGSSLIRSSQEKGVPVFIVLLGSAAGQDSLKRIAEETGGWFYAVSGDSALEEAAGRTREMLRNHYVFSHTSSDTLQDNTWRVVETTLSAYGRTRTDQGLYRTRQGSVNLAVQISGRGTTWTSASGDTAWFVQTNEQAAFRITVKNVGHKQASNVTLLGVLPHNLVPTGGGLYTVRGDTVQWKFGSLPIRSSAQVSLTCLVDTVFQTGTLPLAARALISAAEDAYAPDNTAADTLYYIPLKLPDLSARVRGQGDSTVVIKKDTLRYAHANKQVTYRVTLTNLGELACTGIQVKNVLPDKASLISFPDAAYSQKGDTLFWSVDRIGSRGAVRAFTYTCKVDSLLPPWETSLINRLSTTCAQDADLFNNAHADTVWAAGLIPPDPQVRVGPATVEPTDSVGVQVMSPVQIRSWDVRIIYENGEQNAAYGDAFIAQHTLTPGQWTFIVPSIDDTRMRTTETEERVAVVLQTVDLWDVTRTDTVYFTIRSSDAFVLDHNLFRPGDGGPLNFRFKISSMRTVSLAVYDIAGGFVKRLADGWFDAGWNQIAWNGSNERNESVGSGVYVAVLSTGPYKKALKFMVVR
jgi:VWFA-related protein